MFGTPRSGEVAAIAEAGGGGLSLAFGLRSFSPLADDRSFLLDADLGGGELSGVAKAERLPVVDTGGEGGEVTVVVVKALVALEEALVAVVCWLGAVTGGVVRLRRARGMYTARSGRRSRVGRAGLVAAVLLLLVV